MFIFICLAKIEVQRVCFVIKLGTNTKKGKNSTSIVEIGHLVHRLNMTRGKCAKKKPAALEIVPDTLFVGEF